MKKDTNLLNTQDVRAEAATALTPNATNGEKIKALRTAQGMSMAELSRRASMSDRAIRYIEAGEREPSVDAIQKIAAALGVTTDYFMDDATFQKELSDDQFYADVRKKYGSRGVAQAKKIQSKIPVADIFCIQSHDFFKICDITSTAYLPHTGNSWFDGDSGSVMQFIFQ